MCCKILIGGVAFIVGVEVGKRLPKRETVDTFKANVVRRVTRVVDGPDRRHRVDRV